MENSFLKNFKNMRKNLVSAPQPVLQERKTGIQQLIQDKPSPAVVKEYFKQRVLQLSQDEDNED